MRSFNRCYAVLVSSLVLYSTDSPSSMCWPPSSCPFPRKLFSFVSLLESFVPKLVLYAFRLFYTRILIPLKSSAATMEWFSSISCPSLRESNKRPLTNPVMIPLFRFAYRQTHLKSHEKNYNYKQQSRNSCKLLSLTNCPCLSMSAYTSVLCPWAVSTVFPTQRCCLILFYIARVGMTLLQLWKLDVSVCSNCSQIEAQAILKPACCAWKNLVSWELKGSKRPMEKTTSESTPWQTSQKQVRKESLNQRESLSLLPPFWTSSRSV